MMEGIQFNTQSFTEQEVEAMIEGLNKQYSLGKVKNKGLLTYQLPLIHHLRN